VSSHAFMPILSIGKSWQCNWFCYVAISRYLGVWRSSTHLHRQTYDGL